MDGTAAQRVKRAIFTEDDALNRCVVAQHRYENIAAARIGNALGNLRALARKSFRFAAALARPSRSTRRLIAALIAINLITSLHSAGTNVRNVIY